MKTIVPGSNSVIMYQSKKILEEKLHLKKPNKYLYLYSRKCDFSRCAIMLRRQSESSRTLDQVSFF